MFLSSFPRNALPKWRKLVFFCLTVRDRAHFKLHKRESVHAAILKTNPQTARSTWQTRVQSHKPPSASLPVNTPNTSLFLCFFILSAYTIFNKSCWHQYAQIHFILQVIFANDAFLKVWRKVKSSWKEAEASLFLLTAQTAAQINSSCPTSSFKVFFCF